MQNAMWIAIATIIGTSSGARAEGPTERDFSKSPCFLLLRVA